MAEVEAGYIRDKILHGFDSRHPEGASPCVSELANLAIDTSFPGFEDPRSAAIEGLLSVGRWNYRRNSLRNIACERDGCDVDVSVDTMADTVEIAGKCALEGYCTKKDWDDREKGTYVQVMKNGINRNSQYSASTECPHVDCTFHCGFSIDGPSGTGGSCRQDANE